MATFTSQNKVLSVFSLVMINIIAIDSLRNLPLNATQGYAIAFFYLMGAIGFLLPCILATQFLARRFPLTGGSYIWVREAFGPGAGFVTAWLLWIYNVIWFPTILAFVAGNIAYLFNPALANHKSFMVIAIMIMFGFATLANCFGVRTSSRVSALGAIVGTIVPMLAIIILGAFWLVTGHAAANTFSWQALFPNLNKVSNWSFFIAVLFSLIGIEMSAVHAGDVKNPKRDYPRALYISAAFIIFSLIFSSLAITLILPIKSVSLVTGLEQAFQTFLVKLHLANWLPVIILTIIVGAFACVSAWVLGPARSMMVAAQDKVAPRFFAKSNRYGAPFAVLMLQAVIVFVLSLLFICYQSFNEYYWLLGDLTAQLALIYYLLIFTSALRLAQGSRNMLWRLGIYMGIVVCFIAIGFGFIPPTGIPFSSVWLYDATLLCGIIIFVLPPLLIVKLKRTLV